MKKLTEGKFDPYIFKAIFMTGGPGAGKTHVANKIAHVGLKHVNIDTIYNKLINKSRPKSTFDDLIYARSGELIDAQRDMYVSERLGMVIDGTGRDYDRIRNLHDELEEMGYSCALVYVDAPMDLAFERVYNRHEERFVDEDFFYEAHHLVEKNLPLFRSLFGNDRFVTVKNTDSLPMDSTSVRKINKFLNSKISPIAQQWLSDK